MEVSADPRDDDDDDTLSEPSSPSTLASSPISSTPANSFSDSPGHQETLSALPPRPPTPWESFWFCHRCKKKYKFGVTNRCLEDGQYFCITRCSWWFDFSGWGELKRWRDEVDKQLQVEGEADGLELSTLPSTPLFESPERSKTPSPPLPPLPLRPPTPKESLWLCHKCKRTYRLGVTNRCLHDGHYFCAGRIHDAKAVPARRGRLPRCFSEFDFSGWEEMNHWRDEVHELLQVKTKAGCWNDCAHPGDCEKKRMMLGGDSNCESESANVLAVDPALKWLQVSWMGRFFFRARPH